MLLCKPIATTVIEGTYYGDTQWDVEARQRAPTGALTHDRPDPQEQKGGAIIFDAHGGKQAAVADGVILFDDHVGKQAAVAVCAVCEADRSLSLSPPHLGV
jgi:hypothetical protein